MSQDFSLDDFSLRPLSHTGLFGVFLGVHAIDGALNILHTGVGCKGKTQRQIVQHDLGREAHARVGWTELREEDLIRVPSAVLQRSTVELYRRRSPEIMLVTASSAVEFTGGDLAAEVRKLQDQVDCPVCLIPKSAYQSDLYAGYAAVIEQLLRLVPWKQAPAEKPTLSLVGYHFHRHEMEQAANLNELKRLTEALGGDLGPTFLGGEPLKALMGAHASSALRRLPYAGMPAEELGRLTGRRVVSAGLPLGLSATGEWLQQAGSALGADPKRVKQVIEREEARAGRGLEIARRVLSGKRLGIVADTPLAEGLSSLASELGLDVVLTVTLDRSLKGPAAGAGVVGDPTLKRLRELAGEIEMDLAVRPSLALEGSAWDKVPAVECGFPASRKHFVYPLPELGYTGAVALAQRLMDAARSVH